MKLLCRHEAAYISKSGRNRLPGQTPDFCDSDRLVLWSRERFTREYLTGGVEDMWLVRPDDVETVSVTESFSGPKYRLKSTFFL